MHDYNIAPRIQMTWLSGFQPVVRETTIKMVRRSNNNEIYKAVMCYKLFRCKVACQVKKYSKGIRLRTTVIRKYSKIRKSFQFQFRRSSLYADFLSAISRIFN